MICFHRTCISGRNILVFSEEPGIQVPPEPPRPDDCVQASWQGPFFSRNNTYLDFQPYLCAFHIFWKSKRRGNSPEEGSTNFQPVMFDMDPFGDKKGSLYQVHKIPIISLPTTCYVAWFAGIFINYVLRRWFPNNSFVVVCCRGEYISLNKSNI